LAALEAGATATVIEAALTSRAAYKAWIAGSFAPKGSLTIDAGAARALMTGTSLLAAGVTGVEGRFDKGDAVIVRGPTGEEIARGLSRYDAADAARIIGLKSAAIEAELGFTEGPLIHADDLALG
jgi:glutamate 5-kinase